MKYLINKYKDKDYNGKLNLDEFDLEGFQDGSDSIYGDSIPEKVWWALRDLGYSEIVVAGAMGNIDYESGGFSADAVENGGSGEGIGLIQWSFSRRTGLEKYAQSKGVSWKDVDTQIEYLVTEITGKGAAKGYATRRVTGAIGSEGIYSTSTDWKNSETINDATLHFMRFFESPRDKSSYNERCKRSQKWYDKFKGTKKSIGDYGKIDLSAEDTKKMQEMLDDAVRIANDNSYKYVWGAAHSGPNGWVPEPKSFDCSSFVSYLYYKHFGKNINGDTETIASKQKSVPLSNVQPGDILYRYGHVDMYLGNGKRVGAHSSKTGIYVDQYKRSDYTKAIRIIFKK